MIQRNAVSQRWKQQWIIASSLALSLAVGILAAQEAKQAAPPKDQAPAKVQPAAKTPPKEQPAIKAPMQTAAVPAGAIFQGGVQFQVAPRIGMGQIGGAPAQAEGNGSNERVKLPVDPRARRKIDDAKRFIELQDWQSAVKILQMLLDANEDNFLQETETDKGRRVSVRAEANRLLGSLPREGKQFYEQQFGAQAKLSLKQAKANGNPQALAEVALKYVHTDAGAEAAALLGSYHLDHGRYIVAALCYERLMSREDNLANLSATTLLKAAFAFERAGDVANRDKAWMAFQAKAHQGTEKLPAAVRSWDETKLKGMLSKRIDVSIDQAKSEWALFMGSPDRTAHSLGTDPFLEPMFPPYEAVPPGPARKEVEEAAKKLANLGFPVIPGSHPVVVRSLVVFRALDGIHAFNLKTGQMEWNSTSDAGLAQMIRGQSSADPESTVNIYRYRDTAPNMITENTLLGTLSADQELIYAVEDMAIPPVSSNYGNPFGGFNPRSMPRLGDKLADFMSCNHLTAFDIEGGRAVWSIGTREAEQPFTDTFFLGPPLPLGEKLYVLAESNAEIKLLCLQTRRAPKPGNHADYQYGVELVWAQPLGVVDRRISEDPVRRTQAATLSYSDGILICPTNAGSIVAVDLLTRSLVWAYSYQSEVNNIDADNMIFMGGGGRARFFRGGPMSGDAMFGSLQWSFSAPVISGGKVLIAPPDGKALQAVNLRDGSLAWSVNRVENAKDASISDNFLAGVFDGKVILVGKASIRALELGTGKQVWRTAINIPVGRGTANERAYFIPVRGNEIWAVSLNDGRVTGKSKALHKEQIGNLVLVGDELISLNHNVLLVYPQQAVKERQVAQRLKENPNDPIGLLERGELRWHQGDRENAVADFRAALANKPALATKDAAQTKLFDADCELLEVDFNRHEKLLVECERLLADSPPPASEGANSGHNLDRRSRLLCITAQGREHQGRVLDALQCYRDYAKLDSKLIPSPEDPQTKILPAVWARAQAQALVMRAKPEQQEPLQAQLREFWQQVEKNSDEAARLTAMIQFADFYGDIPGVGHQAQLIVAERLAAAKDFTQAQLRLLPLLQAQERTIAAHATETLARINKQMGEMENAVYYLRILAKRYPNVIVRDGKTGLQIFQEITTDKRFLPYLDEPRGLAGLGEFDINKDVSQHGFSGNFGFKVDLAPPSGLPPSLARFSVQIKNANNNNVSYQYIITDQNEDAADSKQSAQGNSHRKPAVSESLNVPTLLPYTYQGAGVQGLAAQYQVCGQAFVFAWGNQLVSVDPIQKKQLWTIDVLGEDESSNLHNAPALTTRRFSSNLPAQIMPHPQIPGRFQLYWSSGKVETLGTLGPGSPHCITATMKDQGLVALDPQTGAPLWTRSDVSPEAQLFGDSQYVIALSSQPGQRPVAFRLSDGQRTVLSNDVEALYRDKIAQHGRLLLVKSQNSGGLSLRLVDPLSLQTPIWEKSSMPADSMTVALSMPHSAGGQPGGADDKMVGCLMPSGDLHLFDLLTGNTLAQVHLNLKTDLKALKQGHLLADQDCYYLFLCEATEQKDKSGVSRQLFPQYQALPGVIVNGPAFAIDRHTKQVLWQDVLPLNYLITQRFAELPVLLCAATFMESKQPIPRPGAPPANVPPNLVMAPRNGSLQSEVKLFAKQTGKALPIEFKNADFERYNRGTMQGVGFRDLIVERSSGRVELLSASQRFAFRITPRVTGEGEETASGAKGD